MKKIIIIVVSVIIFVLLFFLGINLFGNKTIEKANNYISKVEEKINEEEIKNAVCEISNGYLICEDKTLTIDDTSVKKGYLVIIDGKISNVDILVDNKKIINIDNELVIDTKKDEEIIVKGDNSGAEIPKLYSNKLIPVIHNGLNWVIANVSEAWYDYDKQMWANAVILKPGITKEVGDVVNVDTEVQGMFVWIPRYEYKIENTYGTKTSEYDGVQVIPGIIDINFISKNTTVPQNGYIIPPAFTFNNKELSGIWVSKFNTSTDKTSECYNSDANVTDIYEHYNEITLKCNNENITPYVIPNVKSLIYQNVHNQYITAIKMSLYTSNMDAHMSKNSEYTSILYLTESKYGKYGNNDYSYMDKYVKANNNKDYITGCGSNTLSPSISDECNEYVTSYGMEASTTGNITGVYDMNSNIGKRVMGYLDTNFTVETTNDFTSSGFLTKPNNKYADIFELNERIIDYDIYNLAEADLYIKQLCSSKKCIGQGLSEIYRWRENEDSYTYKFLTIENPWIVRGLYNEFNFISDRGIAEDNVTFRITLIDN